MKRWKRATRSDGEDGLEGLDGLFSADLHIDSSITATSDSLSISDDLTTNPYIDYMRRTTASRLCQVERMESPYAVYIENGRWTATDRREEPTPLSDEDYVELDARLELEYDTARERRRSEGRRFHETDEEYTRRAVHERWENHRRDNPDCDCERCETYRGRTGEGEEDFLGW